MLRVGTARATAVHHDVIRRLTARNTGGTKAVVEFDGAENSALLDSRGPASTGAPVGLLEPLGADGRPVGVPAPGSSDFADHHAVTAKNGADRILVRNVESAGHNGDSFQCGEEDGTARPVTSNITLVGNRFHQVEENAVDLKACHGVTSFPGMPPDSLVGNPRFVADPANNDYFTQRGSPARDTAAAVLPAVHDPRPYCDDPSADTLIEPDIGFLESCS